MSDSSDLQEAQEALEFVAGTLRLIPLLKVGALTTLGTTLGRDQFGASIQAFAGALGVRASATGTRDSMSATLGGYDRRTEEWTHQQNLATKELDQVQKQIDAATIRKEIAEQELQNHDLQSIMPNKSMTSCEISSPTTSFTVGC